MYKYKSISRFHHNKNRFISSCERDGWFVCERKGILPTYENGYPKTGGVLLTFCKPASGETKSLKQGEVI